MASTVAIFMVSLETIVAVNPVGIAQCGTDDTGGHTLAHPRDRPFRGSSVSITNTAGTTSTTNMAGWIHDGRVGHREGFVDGLENATGAFRDLLEGGNSGKLIVCVGDDAAL
jgi:hypothetical protein